MAHTMTFLYTGTPQNDYISQVTEHLIQARAIAPSPGNSHPHVFFLGSTAKNFDAIQTGAKSYEILHARLNARLGDHLVFQEQESPDNYTGSILIARITSLLEIPAAPKVISGQVIANFVGLGEPPRPIRRYSQPDYVRK